MLPLGHALVMQARALVVPGVNRVQQDISITMSLQRHRVSAAWLDKCSLRLGT